MKKTTLDYLLKVRIPVVIFVAALAFTLTFYISRPERDGIGYTPEQPIPFSHKLHAGEMFIDCQYCHSTVSNSRFANVPATGVCMNCHSVARKNKENIIKLTQHYEQNKPLAWKRVHRVPDYAYFNHSVHINKGIDCTECHGRIKDMEVVQQVSSFTMGSCLNCHRNSHDKLPQIKKISKGPENCFACHR